MKFLVTLASIIVVSTAALAGGGPVSSSPRVTAAQPPMLELARTVQLRAPRPQPALACALDDRPIGRGDQLIDQRRWWLAAFEMAADRCDRNFRQEQFNRERVPEPMRVAMLDLGTLK